jgi:hypothetical protein
MSFDPRRTVPPVFLALVLTGCSAAVPGTGSGPPAAAAITSTEAGAGVRRDG